MLVKIRDGLDLRDNAAASLLRLESKYGPVDINRSTVPFADQDRLFKEWKAGMHPDIPVVLDPRKSVHVYRENDEHSGVAVDSDTYNVPWEEYGWVQVNRKELWHREYFQNKDKHYGEEIDDMQPNELDNALRWDVRRDGFGADAKNGPTIWNELGAIKNMLAAQAQQLGTIKLNADVDEKALAEEMQKRGITVVILDKQ